jgi:membrane-bound acyltransferase YfiQ involved in biofilm formation
MFGAVVTLVLVQYIYHSGILMRVTSARFDIIPYTILLFFLFFFFVSKAKRIPRWAVSFSGYSYGIYLLHPFVQTVVNRRVPISETTELSYLLFQFAAGVVVPIGLIYILSKLPFGAFIVGKTNARKKIVKEREKPKAA